MRIMYKLVSHKMPMHYRHGMKKHAGNCMDMFPLCKNGYNEGYTEINSIQEVCG